MFKRFASIKTANLRSPSVLSVPCPGAAGAGPGRSPPGAFPRASPAHRPDAREATAERGHLSGFLVQRPYSCIRPGFMREGNSTLSGSGLTIFTESAAAWRKEWSRCTDGGRKQVWLRDSSACPFVRFMFLIPCPWVLLDILKPGFA